MHWIGALWAAADGVTLKAVTVSTVARPASASKRIIMEVLLQRWMGIAPCARSATRTSVLRYSAQSLRGRGEIRDAAPALAAPRPPRQEILEPMQSDNGVTEPN